MNTVWIVQNKTRYNTTTRCRESVFNFDAAKEYGNLNYLLSDQDSILAQVPTLNKLKKELFNFTKNDSLLLIGDPVLIGAAITIVANYNNLEVPVLLYEKYSKLYYRRILKF